MKSLKRGILIILVLNLIAMLVGIGWLLSSGRVNKERVLDLTQLFEVPVAVEQAQLAAQEKAKAEADALKEREVPDLALNSDERNLVRIEMTQIDIARMDRMRREIEDLRASLRKERQGLAQARSELQKEEEAFQAMRDRLAELEGGQQFKKALDTLTTMAAKDAKAVLSSLLANTLLTNEGGKYEEVVSYLSAMDERARASIMTEFVKAGDEKLAADLLESVRLRGIEATTASGINP